MKCFTSLLLALFIIIIFYSCNDDTDFQPFEQTTAINLVSSSSILTDDFKTTVEGISTLTRSKYHIEVIFEALESPNLDPRGHAITLWAAFYKNDIDYLENPQKPYAMYLVDGVVCDQSGEIILKGKIGIGTTDNLWLGSTLTTPETDFILLTVITHGYAERNPEMLEAQLTTLNGGCNRDKDGAGPAPPCFEFLFSRHQRPSL